jgi:tetratricopeptide (TPR) repeat protein
LHQKYLEYSPTNSLDNCFMKKALIFVFSICTTVAFAQSDYNKYKKIEADEYFQAGRYWDAFFLYRNLAKSPDFQGDYSIENQIKNSSRAMFHWKKTQDYRAFQEYEIAKTHMKGLLEINPYDPNRGLLPVLTLELANQMKRRAIASRTEEGAADFLGKALNYYNLALEEGIKDEMVFSFIKQVENALEKNPYSSKIKQPTTYDINYQKDKIERARSVEILNKQEN